MIDELIAEERLAGLKREESRYQWLSRSLAAAAQSQDLGVSKRDFRRQADPDAATPAVGQRRNPLTGVNELERILDWGPLV